MTQVERIVIVGSTGSSHIGGSLVRAAEKIGVGARLCDVNHAWRHGTLRQKLLWHFGGHRPLHLRRFNQTVLRTCDDFKPQVLLATGTAPICANLLRRCRHHGIRCLNFSTDDPFNARQRAEWFMSALREYDIVFTPRRSNMRELLQHGCRVVEYLPFGYDPDLFFREECRSSSEENDLFFAGTGDRDRVAYIAEALSAGMCVRLHGINWHRFTATAAITRGQADIPALRQAIACCKIALILVRHENRDGNSMRTFEVPAVGACMLVEDTSEHRQIFGDEGKCVVYFRDPNEMVQKARVLLEQPEARLRMRHAVHSLIIHGHNTYEDRLRSILS